MARGLLNQGWHAAPIGLAKVQASMSQIVDDLKALKELSK